MGHFLDPRSYTFFVFFPLFFPHDCTTHDPLFFFAQIWYPCGSFKGDDRSAALAKSWSEGGMLSGISKKQLDGGIAGSLYSDLAKLKDTVMRAYPQLRKKSNEMEFGYKLAFDGLPEDKAKQTFPVEPKEPKGALDGLRNIFS